MRKTKIICTIGPASAGEEILARMCRSGMNVARLNFSHGSHEEHLEKIKMIKKVREKLGYPLPIMLDTCAMAIDTKAKGIVISSLSEITVRMVSRFRCPVDIVGMTTSSKAWRKLNLSWGVTPVMSDEFDSVDVMFYHAARHATDFLGLKSGDNIILTGGQASKQSGTTNTIRMETIK